MLLLGSRDWEHLILALTVQKLVIAESLGVFKALRALHSAFTLKTILLEDGKSVEVRSLLVTCSTLIILLHHHHLSTTLHTFINLLLFISTLIVL